VSLDQRVNPLESTLPRCHHHPVTGLNAADVLRIGGWHPRYARVLDIVVDGDIAAALVDTNGDGADLNLDIYLLDDDGGWREVMSGNGSMWIPGAFVQWTEDDKIVLTRTDIV
jgi:hypothetical protein